MESSWNDMTHLLLLLRCSDVATRSWMTLLMTLLVLLLLMLLLLLGPSMDVCYQPLAKASRICQGKGGLLVKHPHKHPGHHKLALQRLEPEGLQGMQGKQLSIVTKKALADQQLLFKTDGRRTASRQQAISPLIELLR